MEHALNNEQRPYLPAAGYDRTLPLYDPLMKLFGVDAARGALIEPAGLHPGCRVLDIGCGTGTLATQIKSVHPKVQVVGLDPDLKALARGRHKAQLAGVSIQFDRGYADDLPYSDASFDRVFSSFMFHHLPEDMRRKALREVRRVLQPGGSLYLLDFAMPDSHAPGLFAHLFGKSHRLRDNSDERILALMREAGFEDSIKTKERSLLLGILPIAYYEGSTKKSPRPSI